jgi:flavoprotein
LQEFFETQVKDIAVLNEKVGLTSSANNVNLDEMDALVEVLVESLKK